MSKPDTKKTARQQRKRKERLGRRKNRPAHRLSSVSILPSRGELLGVPMAGARWLGLRIASLFRRRG